MQQYTADKKKWSNLKTLSKNLRRSQTEAEIIVWNVVRSRNLKYKFRRQHVVAGYIVDFVCIELKLIIEIDGIIHDFQKDYDKSRSEIFDTIGFKVLRISNSFVISNEECLVEYLKGIINNMK